MAAYPEHDHFAVLADGRDRFATVRNGAHASLMTPAEKAKMLGEIDRVLAETS